MVDYLVVTCRLPATAEEGLAAALEGWPALGCQVEDAGSQEVRVTVYLEEGQAAALDGIQEGLVRLGGRSVHGGPFVGRDWLAEYRGSIKAGAIGRRFWVDPDPVAPTPPPDGRIHLVIEPRQAFGTGSHESTRLVLLVLEDFGVEGCSVLDVGTGSGILALAARALGARRVVGFDIDLEAVLIAGQTRALQPGRWPVELLAGPIAAIAGRPMFDVILANLLPAQVQPILPALRERVCPEGRVVLSGVMADQQAAMEAELRAQGMEVTGTRRLGEWVALVCRQS